MTASFKKELWKVTVLYLASLVSVIVVVILAIAIFACDPIGTVRGRYVFLQTKIAKKYRTRLPTLMLQKYV